MTRKGPLVTLLGGGVLAGGLLVANVLNTPDEPDDDQAVAAAEQTADAEPTETAQPEPEPAATEEPEPADAETDAEPANDAEPVTYVGWVDGGGTSVAIVIDGDQATAYVCDGENEAWLTGTTDDGELNLTGDKGELSATYDQNYAIGEAVVNGRTQEFTIEYVAPPEGLYQVADTIVGGAEVEGGWIVLPDGRQIGVLNVGGDAQSAPELDPDTGEVTVDDTTITADRLGGE